jgi:diguanylate cyclase (GGDEF)-like protein
VRLNTWIPIFLAPVVALLAFLAIARFTSQADESRQAQVHYSQLAGETNGLNTLEWRAIASRQVDNDLRADRHARGAHIEGILRTLGAVDRKDASSVAQRIRSYETALDAELQLIAQRRFGEAETLDEDVVDPGFGALSLQLRKAQEAEAAQGAAAIRRARLGTGASLASALVCLLLLFWRFHHGRRKLMRSRADELYAQASHDSLTGLPNRRKLIADLQKVVEEATPADPQRLIMFDLDGFKSYNDTFGHPEGDLLLRRMGKRFASAVEGTGTAYRLGGDEFCALIPEAGVDTARVTRDCCEALAEDGEAFAIRASFGVASIPREATTASEALHLTDQRMYAHKHSGRLSARQQTRSLALKILAEQQPALREHAGGVAELARAVGKRLGLDQDRLDEVERAAELHDLGKIAIPDSILAKQGPLDDEEWRFMRRHTLIAERMLQAAPALASIGKLVRSSHERFDGAGYPDGLLGENIPLASRIVFVCDAYESMTSDRSYRPRMDERSALGELRRHSGTQFDPTVVDTFCDELEATKARRDSPVAEAA